MKHILLLVAVLFLSFQAEAISLRYKFKVFSSGPSIYPCNAGVIAQPTSQKVCYFENTQNVCNPDSCSTAKGNCESRCVCTGDNGGDYLQNYGVAEYKDWKDHHQLNSVTGKGKKTFAVSSSKPYAFEDNASWDKVLTNLHFDLGSELYSAKYYVDICYRGSQIEYFEDQVAANWSVFTQAAGVNFLANGVNGGENNRDGLVIPEEFIKYTERAGVQVQTYVSCDFQGTGNYVYARNANGQYNTADNEAGFSLASTGNPNGATEGSGSFLSSSASSLPASGVTTIDQWLVNNSSKAPRFCKVRYVFTETNYKAAKPNLRSWTRHGAEMCTYTKIEEDADQGSTNWTQWTN